VLGCTAIAFHPTIVFGQYFKALRDSKMALILIVEDAMFSRKMIRKTLQKQGYETLEAKNGKEGLELVREVNPDCILLDLLMPEIDGWEFLKILRAEGYKTPTIVITADIQETSRQQCLELGAQAVLNKPPQAQVMQDAIEAVLATPSEG
jgi:CheY-like chemotaxis protein